MPCLNISKFLDNGRYATAQLTAHELGHCIGLRHTNTPQFSDLPRNDKFGWVNCNSNNVSNNIMGYNLCRNYLSPMQIGDIHYRYSTINELSLTTNNLMSNSSKIVIKKNTNWDKNILSKLVSILNEYPNLILEVNSHTDSRGPAVYNQKLSEIRLQSTLEYLFKNGIQPNRVVGEAYGEEKLVNECHLFKVKKIKF